MTLLDGHVAVTKIRDKVLKHLNIIQLFFKLSTISHFLYFLLHALFALFLSAVHRNGHLSMLSESRKRG